ncbi:hypothetical protein DSO57_1004437 [Entomophthora muscae]|uniref:Uncharacterized protein n=1 Tax=Entomophthora muscae TaxID=34485 RepID=A0ACC2TJU8_9FUNG|nr:hypothetical protein DSO57_1004437 [Entomophthora muscae]
MNHLIFTAVFTACLGIEGYQQVSEFFGPSPDGLGHDPHYNPGQLNSSQTGPWTPLVSPHSTLSIAMSFGRYNVHAKVFCWLMTVYRIITALTGFHFTNLLPYILQVVPTVTGYYTCQKIVHRPEVCENQKSKITQYKNHNSMGMTILSFFIIKFMNL